MGHQNQIFTKSMLKPIVRNVNIVSFIFCLVLSLVLILNYIQLKRTDPLNTPALEKMVTQLSEQPDNIELRRQIRELNLLTRKAFFTGMNQVKTGAIILFVIFLIFAASLKLLLFLDSPPPTGKIPESPLKKWSIQEKGMLIMGATLLISTTTSLALAFLSARDYSDQALFSVPTTESHNFSKKPLPGEQSANDALVNNWPSFRGPFGRGISYAENPPQKWNGTTGENILWQVKLDRPGFSSPIIWEDRVFITAADSAAREVLCYDLKSGATIFRKVIRDIPASADQFPEVADDTGYGASTCTTDGSRVYAIFATGLLTALDFKGEIIWEQNLGVPANHYGHSSSLILHGDTLLVQFDQETQGTLLGLERNTGSILWKTTRDVITSWASPLLIPEENKVLLNADPYAGCYNAQTGAEIWTADIMSGEIGASPAYTGGIAIFANKFAVLAGLDLKSGEILWEHYDNLPDVSSPLGFETYVFMTDNTGVMTCLEAATGKVYWQYEFEKGFYSSPIAAGGLIYATDLEGVTRIIRPGPVFDLMGSNPIGEKVVATPAFVEGRMVIRGLHTLYCIGE